MNIFYVKKTVGEIDGKVQLPYTNEQEVYAISGNVEALEYLGDFDEIKECDLCDFVDLIHQLPTYNVDTSTAISYVKVNDESSQLHLLEKSIVLEVDGCEGYRTVKFNATESTIDDVGYYVRTIDDNAYYFEMDLIDISYLKCLQLDLKGLANEYVRMCHNEYSSWTSTADINYLEPLNTLIERATEELTFSDLLPNLKATYELPEYTVRFDDLDPVELSGLIQEITYVQLLDTILKDGIASLF